MVNGQQIRQVALNLLTNALESVDQDGAVDIRIRQERDLVVVTVQDDGCGMTDEVLEHLFEPFFTRRRDGKGTGLGLSITHRIVTQHGGKLTAHSEGLGRGSQMRLELPVEAAETADAQKRAAPKLSETNITTKSEYAPLEAVNQKDPRDERRRVA
jgi:signal transduction histidine kinase